MRGVEEMRAKWAAQEARSAAQQAQMQADQARMQARTPAELAGWAAARPVRAVLCVLASAAWAGAGRRDLHLHLWQWGRVHHAGLQAPLPPPQCM